METDIAIRSRSMLEKIRSRFQCHLDLQQIHLDHRIRSVSRQNRSRRKFDVDHVMASIFKNIRLRYWFRSWSRKMDLERNSISIWIWSRYPKHSTSFWISICLAVVSETRSKKWRNENVRPSKTFMSWYWDGEESFLTERSPTSRQDRHPTVGLLIFHQRDRIHQPVWI